MKNKEPELRDEVKHKMADMTGIVIAKWPSCANPEEDLLDVRGANDKIYYSTPAKNWEVVRENNE